MLRKIVIALVATAVIAFVPTGASAEVFSMAVVSMAVVSMVAVLAEVAGAAVAGVAAAELDQLRAVYPKGPESELTKALGLGRLAFGQMGIFISGAVARQASQQSPAKALGR